MTAFTIAAQLGRRCGDPDCDPYGGYYRTAREGAFRRVTMRIGGKPACAFCGYYTATEAHHWERRYPCGCFVTSNDLTPLCKACHDIATKLRRDPDAVLRAVLGDKTADSLKLQRMELRQGELHLNLMRIAEQRERELAENNMSLSEQLSSAYFEDFLQRDAIDRFKKKMEDEERMGRLLVDDSEPDTVGHDRTTF